MAATTVAPSQSRGPGCPAASAASAVWRVGLLVERSGASLGRGTAQQ